MFRDRKNLLITGRPGVGKTTLIREVIADLPLRPGGFFTQEIRESGRRVGFEIVVLTANLPRRRGILAQEGLISPHRVGRYGVNQADMEEVGARSLEEALREYPLIVIDEIGNMEIISGRFRKAVIACLESPVPVLGVIKAGEGPFVSEIKSRPDVEFVELTRENREVVKKRLEGWIAIFFGDVLGIT